MIIEYRTEEKIDVVLTESNNSLIVIGLSIVNGGKPAFVDGFWYTNDAWTVDAILNGDGMSPGKFEATDWLKCTVIGTKQGGSTVEVDIDLASEGNYVKDWQYCDLSSMGKVVELSFVFTGSKSNDWGLTTPSYMCIDDIQIEK